MALDEAEGFVADEAAEGADDCPVGAEEGAAAVVRAADAGFGAEAGVTANGGADGEGPSDERVAGAVEGGELFGSRADDAAGGRPEATD